MASSSRNPSPYLYRTNCCRYALMTSLRCRCGSLPPPDIYYRWPGCMGCLVVARHIPDPVIFAPARSVVAPADIVRCSANGCRRGTLLRLPHNHVNRRFERGYQNPCNPSELLGTYRPRVSRRVLYRMSRCMARKQVLDSTLRRRDSVPLEWDQNKLEPLPWESPRSYSRGRHCRYMHNICAA